MKDIGENHDGYHTFNELYEHRHLLFLNMIEYHRTAWKSKLHSDGTMFDDMFIAGVGLSTGMISYHLPMRLWDVANVIALKKAPKWDGHTPQDVCDRLLKRITRDK